MSGTITVYGCTLYSELQKAFTLKSLKELAKECIKSVGFTLRRFDAEEYKKPKEARTLVAYLNESHLMLTTYPEDKLIELELATCKQVQLSGLVARLQAHEEFIIRTQFIVDKDEHGKWIQGNR